MKRYYAELATSALHEAAKKITEAQQYLDRATEDLEITCKLIRTKSAINNRIEEIFWASKNGED